MKLKKKMLAVMAVATMLVGSMTVFAADTNDDNDNTPVLESTSDDNGVLCDDGYIEYTEPADPDFVPEVPAYPIIGAAYYNRSMKTIDLTVANGQESKTTAFSCSSGGSIGIAVVIRPVNKTVKVGIIQPDGTKRYISASNDANHTFSLTQSGKYKVYASNNSGVTVMVAGSCVY